MLLLDVWITVSVHLFWQINHLIDLIELDIYLESLRFVCTIFSVAKGSNTWSAMHSYASGRFEYSWKFGRRIAHRIDSASTAWPVSGLHLGGQFRCGWNDEKDPRRSIGDCATFDSGTIEQFRTNIAGNRTIWTMHRMLNGMTSETISKATSTHVLSSCLH